jgi:hypothetical protein
MSAVSLEDMKDHLSISSEEDDWKLQGFVDTAEVLIAHHTGPLTPTAVTVRVPGRMGPLALPVTPVISLTTVTPSYGTNLDITHLDVDPVLGLVAYQGYYSSFVSYFPMAWYQVTYQAGYATLPTPLATAVKEQVRMWWEVSQRGGRRAPSQGQEQPVYMGHELHPMVQLMLAPYDHLTFA